MYSLGPAFLLVYSSLNGNWVLQSETQVENFNRCYQLATAEHARKEFNNEDSKVICWAYNGNIGVKRIDFIYDAVPYTSRD